MNADACDYMCKYCYGGIEDVLVLVTSAPCSDRLNEERRGRVRVPWRKRGSDL